jgi:hypothetical protein
MVDLYFSIFITTVFGVITFIEVVGAWKRGKLFSWKVFFYLAICITNLLFLGSLILAPKG